MLNCFSSHRTGKCVLVLVLVLILALKPVLRLTPVLKLTLIGGVLGQVRLVCGPQLVGKVECVRAPATSNDSDSKVDQSAFLAPRLT